MIDAPVPTPNSRRSLSSRESQVLALVSLGLTNSEIAKRLSVSVHVVKFHLGGIYRKLDVANRTEATAVYLTQGAHSTVSHVRQTF